MFFARLRLLSPGSSGPENVDRPLSNFDVIGIPTGKWSSHMFSCFENMVPSCLLSFFCPCVMWGQIVVRAQIPMLIGIKNSFACFRGQSGYGLFVDYYFWSFALSLALILVLALVDIQSRILQYFIGVLIVAILGTVLLLTGWSLTAFREKYRLPGWVLPGCTFWDKVADVFLITACFPCMLSRMARHVFQYERMDSPVGCFLGDPYHLPPLPPTDEELANGGNYERPLRADEAGLGVHDQEAMRRHTGAAHRQQEILQQQRQQVFRPSQPPVLVAATPIADGSAVPGRTANPIVATPVANR